MTSLQIYKIAQLYDIKISLTNGIKNYTFEKAQDFSIKFCDKILLTPEEEIVKSLILKKILFKYDLSTGLLNVKEEQRDEINAFFLEHYSSNVVKFMEIVLNDNNNYKIAYDLLETLDDWLVIYEFIRLARLHNKLISSG